MVSSTRVDALNDPTATVQDLFINREGNSLDGFATKVSKHFSEIFASADAFLEIPCLNVQHPPESHSKRSLVRFRSMVQDPSPSPEMYLATLNDGKCGGWGIPDASGAEENVNYAHLRECTVFWAVDVPGESEWVEEELNGKHSHVTDSNKAEHKSAYPHKYSVPDASHLGVQVKIYDTTLAEALKSTSIVNFVGILTSEPWHTALETDDPALVPTLHVLFLQHLPPTLVPREYPYSPPSTPVTALREELISWIADEALAGDREAAEWALLLSIARVQSRTPPIYPPSLTLSRYPPSSSQTAQSPTLIAVLSTLFPTVSTLPLSLDVLNKTPFCPESHDEDLHGGWLQLPQGSVCVLTEGGVREGAINEKGLLNLRAAQEMMNGQTLEYVFPFSRFTFETDVVFLVVCEGRKSAFFQTDINVPLVPATSDHRTLYKSAPDINLPSKEKLEMFRRLVGGAKVGNVTVGEAAAEHIQEDFVKERKEASESGKTAVTSDVLILRMMVARLLALSLHEKEVTIDIWEKAKALEAKRQARLAAI